MLEVSGWGQQPRPTLKAHVYFKNSGYSWCSNGGRLQAGLSDTEPPLIRCCWICWRAVHRGEHPDISELSGVLSRRSIG